MNINEYLLKNYCPAAPDIEQRYVKFAHLMNTFTSVNLDELGRNLSVIMPVAFRHALRNQLSSESDTFSFEQLEIHYGILITKFYKPHDLMTIDELGIISKFYSRVQSMASDVISLVRNSALFSHDIPSYHRIHGQSGVCCNIDYVFEQSDKINLIYISPQRTMQIHTDAESNYVDIVGNYNIVLSALYMQKLGFTVGMIYNFVIEHASEQRRYHMSRVRFDAIDFQAIKDSFHKPNGRIQPYKCPACPAYTDRSCTKSNLAYRRDESC